MIWRLSHRADKKAARIADRHYSRQKPGTDQFVPPGRCCVLWTPKAYWVTSWPFKEYVKHAWGGAWLCSAFRNEGAGLSSELIEQAVSATRWYYGEPPELGMVTFIDATKIKSTNPGCCFKMAGFKTVGETKGGLIALQMLPARMPEAQQPLESNYDLFVGELEPQEDDYGQDYAVD